MPSIDPSNPSPRTPSILLELNLDRPLPFLLEYPLKESHGSTAMSGTRYLWFEGLRLVPTDGVIRDHPLDSRSSCPMCDVLKTGHDVL